MADGGTAGGATVSVGFDDTYTPTGLLESAAVQWFWAKDVFGEDVPAKADGGVSKMVRYPKAGYWISYNMTESRSLMTSRFPAITGYACVGVFATFRYTSGTAYTKCGESNEESDEAEPGTRGGGRGR